MSTAFSDGSFYPIEKEFESVELGDKRLGKRLSQMAKELDRNIGHTINHAFATWADTKAAYRFFSNSHVGAEEIQSVHLEKTKQRMRESQSPYLLVVEDKSTLNFSEHPRTKNLGPIGHKFRKNRTPVQGIYFHGAMVYTPQGVALGLLNQTFWVRPGYGKLTVRRYGQYYKIPRTQKESFRFVEPVLFCQDLQAEVGVPLIVVSDREADINEFLEEAITGHVGFVVRAHERRLCVEEKGYIVDYLERAQKPQAKLKLKVLRRKVLTRKQTQWIKPRRKAGEWRVADLDLYWGRVTLPLRFDGEASFQRAFM
jgi:hypothetical protein